MKEIYPEYADEVAFYVVGVDPSESIEELEAYSDSQGYPWPMAVHERDMLRKLNIRVQSSKVAVDRDGVIVYRDGYAQGSDETWRSVFEELAGKSN